MHIPTFDMPTIRQVWLLIQCGSYAFFLGLKDAYLHIAVLSIIIFFFLICLAPQT